MNRIVRLSLALVFGGALLAPSAFAASIPIGFVSFDVTGPGVAQFDINNETGINSSGDPTFPVTTSVSLSNLNLDIQYSSGPDLIFGPTSGYFSLSPDGISWTGTALSTSVNQSSDGLMGSIDAILTGTFGTTSLTLYDGSTVSVNPGFSATITDSAGLTDGDLAVIYATTTSSTGVIPEPDTFLLMGTGLLALLGRRRNYLAAARRFLSGNLTGTGTMLVALLILGASSITAYAATPVSTVKLNAWANPTTGLAGVNDITVTGSGFPSGAITPSSVTVAFATTCGGTPVATTSPLVVKTVIGSEDQLSEILVPSSLTNGTYYISVSGTSNGGVLFTSAGSCSEVTITATTATLAACVPTSSLAVVAGTNVNAYVPFGYWSSSRTGVEEVPLEGSSTAQNFATTGGVNSCAANSVTNVVICTENSSNVDIIKGSTLTTLTSGADTSASFSGGSCQNCGVGVNAANNTAVIAMGFSGASGSGVQVLNLANNTFTPPFAMSHYVSEDISIDSGRNLILSPDESGNYDLLKIGTGGALTEYGNSVGGTLDSAAEDCTTGVALAADEFTNDIYITDLTQAVFTAGSPAGTWTAPGQFLNVNPSGGGSYAAGTSGISTAPGTNHLAVVTGEFGGSSYAALQLPSTSGSGTPTLADYAYVSSMPNTPDGYPFEAGYDPHTVTAYTSPNTNKSYAVFADYYPYGYPDWLGVVDLACVLAQPRSVANFVSGNASACTRYVPVP